MTEAKWNGDTSIHRGWQGGTETKTREMKLLRDDVGVPSVSRSLGGFVGDFPRAKRPAKIRGILRWVVMEDVVQKLMDIFFSYRGDLFGSSFHGSDAFWKRFVCAIHKHTEEHPDLSGRDAKDGNVDKESCLNTPQPLGISGHRLARSPGSKDTAATDVPNIVQLQRAISVMMCYVIVTLLKLERCMYI